jgi:hypothetical protein
VIESLPDERLELRRGAADGKRRGRLRALDSTAGEGGMEGVRDDRQIGKLGHGARL